MLTTRPPKLSQFVLKVTEKDEAESSILGEGKDESIGTLTKLTALQGPIAILSVCVYGRPGFYWWEK
jgi:hypothetical protein